MKIRLVNEPLDIYLDEIEDKFNILIVESKTLLFQIIHDINTQINGNYGDFVLSIDDEPIDLKNNLELIINPFDLDINNRKILSAIQKLAIIETKNEIHYSETNQLISLIETYAQNISFSFDGNITPKTEITSESLIKMINYQVDIFSTNFDEKLFEYLLNSNKYLNTQVFCFINLFSYFENTQIDQLIKSCNNYHIHVIFIESFDSKYHNNNCKKLIIDSDFCHI